MCASAESSSIRSMPLFARSELVFIIAWPSFCNKGSKPWGLWIGVILQFAAGLSWRGVSRHGRFVAGGKVRYWGPDVGWRGAYKVHAALWLIGCSHETGGIVGVDNFVHRMQHSEKLLGRLRNRRRHDQGRRAQNAAPLYEREVTFGLGSQPPKRNARSSLRDDAVGPLDHADKNGGIAEFCAPLRYICFRDPTGPAAGPSSKDGNVSGHNFFEGFAERRPAHRHDGIGSHFAHQRRGFAEEENLHVMAGFRERESMMKRKRGLGGVIGAPGAFHHDFEHFLFWLFSLRAQG